MSMHTSFGHLRTYLRLSRASSVSLNPIRYASLNSAIGRGIRKSRVIHDSPARSSFNDDYDRHREGNRAGRSSRVRQDSPARNSFNDNYDRHHERKRGGRSQNYNKDGGKSRSEELEFDEGEFIKTGSFRALPREFQRFKSNAQSSKEFGSGFRRDRDVLRENDSVASPQHKRRTGRTETKGHHRFTDEVPERIKENVKVPDSIPYTTPASEFIYGTSAVEAALRCSRRQVYTLYLYQSTGEELNSSKLALRKLALSKNIKVKMAFAGWDRLLDKMSSGRPHNGCILEVSPLPKLPVKSFRAVPSLEEDQFRVELGSQSREEALVNGMNDRIAIHHLQHRKRYPIVLLLDGIVDPGNLGAIIRSAYYLGIDAIVFAGRNSAPLSPVTIKTSAGAAENMTLLEVSNEVAFIQQSKANGWRFYAADAPGPGSMLIDPSTTNNDSVSSDNNPLTQSPCVLMMGSEGEGLSSHIKSQADSIVSIPGARFSADLGVEADPARVDSLNVSVAAAILMEMFLRVPLAVTDMLKKEKMW